MTLVDISKDLFRKAGFSLVLSFDGISFKNSSGVVVGDIDLICFYNMNQSSRGDSKYIKIFVETSTQSSGRNQKIRNAALKFHELLDTCSDDVKLHIENENILSPLKDEILNNFSEMETFFLYIDNGLDEKEFLYRNRQFSKKLHGIYIFGKYLFSYFEYMINSIRFYASFELLDYLDVNFSHLVYEEDQSTGFNCIQIFQSVEQDVYIVSARPCEILKRSIVHRETGWWEKTYQRVLRKDRLVEVREFIVNGGKFVNNIIVAMDIHEENFFVPIHNNSKIGKIRLPNKFNSLFVIDGQHRLYGYTQDYYSEYYDDEEENDGVIKYKANNEYLPVTIITNKSANQSEVIKKNAKFFMDINSEQVKMKNDLIYKIMWDILESNEPEALGSGVMDYLNKQGFFKERIKEHENDKNKIERATIIKYILARLIKIDDSSKNNLLYAIYIKYINRDFNSNNRGEIISYVEWIGNKINHFFSILTEVMADERGVEVHEFLGANPLFFTKVSLGGFIRLYYHILYDVLEELVDNSFTQEKLDEKTREVSKHIKQKFTAQDWGFGSSQWGRIEYAFLLQIREHIRDFGDEEKFYELESRYSEE